MMRRTKVSAPSCLARSDTTEVGGSDHPEERDPENEGVNVQRGHRHL